MPPLQLRFDRYGREKQKLIPVFPSEVEARKHGVAEDLVLIVHHDQLQLGNIGVL